MVRGGGTYYLVRVTNTEQVAVERSRRVFPPLQTIEVIVKGGSQLGELMAATTLRAVNLGEYDIVNRTLISPVEGTEEGVPQRVFGDNGQNLAVSDQPRRPEEDANAAYDGTWSKEQAAAAAYPREAREGVDTSRTVYTGLDAAPETVYTGLERGEREDYGEYPKMNEWRDGAAIVRPIGYEGKSVQELRAIAVQRGLYVPGAVTQDQLIDMLKQSDGDPGSNVHRRPDTFPQTVDPLNVGEETGHIAIEGDEDANIPTDPETGVRVTPDVYPRRIEGETVKTDDGDMETVRVSPGLPEEVVEKSQERRAERAESVSAAMSEMEQMQTEGAGVVPRLVPKNQREGDTVTPGQIRDVEHVPQDSDADNVIPPENEPSTAPQPHEQQRIDAGVSTPAELGLTTVTDVTGEEDQDAYVVHDEVYSASDDLEDMTVPELREIAKREDISLSGANKKQEIIDAIRAGRS